MESEYRLLAGSTRAIILHPGNCFLMLVRMKSDRDKLVLVQNFCSSLHETRTNSKAQISRSFEIQDLSEIVCVNQETWMKVNV